MIWTTGDTHGKDAFKYGAGYISVDGYMPRLSEEAFPEQREMTKDDYVVILGDFGGVWGTNRYCVSELPDEKEGLDWLNDKPFTTLFIPGNHENWDRLIGCRNEELLASWFYADMPESEKEKLRKGYPQKRWHGGTVREIRPSVLMLEPGVFDINGKKCFAYGGAQSHDIQHGILNPAELSGEEEFQSILSAGTGFSRILGVTWWKEEQPSKEDEEKALNALKKHDFKVDFVFTHAPTASTQILLGYSAKTRIDTFLEGIRLDMNYKHWFSGHLHRNQTMPGGQDHILYEQLIQIA